MSNKHETTFNELMEAIAKEARETGDLSEETINKARFLREEIYLRAGFYTSLGNIIESVEDNNKWKRDIWVESLKISQEIR